ncbi:ABC transporter substrate-binding protein [Arthrobacter alpinus]|uniref:ABC transporter substrate-binding protein n=1 Tax=Arthrobacter alpinus TaxID=656366 RepID=UPI0009FB8E42|nr:iron-siderophore ABC transporter substrate-binding protein [Arthrobacter alpinus]
MKNDDSTFQTPTTRRGRRLVFQVLGAVVALGVLAGCATGAKQSSGAGNADVAIGGSKFTTADEETAKLGTDAAAGVFPRVIKHASGETTLEAKPARVVVLDTGELDDVLSLGIKPVGMPTTEGANSIPSYLAGEVDGVATIGTIQDLNLEAIAALKPDLIVGSKLRADKLYSQLAAIAPTVFSIRPGFPWKENFLLVGKALGEETKAVEVLNEYQEQAQQLKADVSGDPKISLVRFMPGKIRLYGNKSLIGVILKDAGLARPENQNIDDLAVEVSAENIEQADSDWVFYSSYGDPATTGETSVVAGPIWSKLESVKAGKANGVNDDVWFLGLGPAGAKLILADLRELLVK